MRLIGYLPNQNSAFRFSDFLCDEGITNEVEQERDRWAVWVHSEDELEAARVWFDRFLGNPQDPQFRRPHLPADPHRKALKPDPPRPAPIASTVEESGSRSIPSYGLGPFTVAVALACVCLSILSHFGENLEPLAPLFITNFDSLGGYVTWQQGLPEFFSGQIWRVFTPVLIHFGFLHLLFNMFWLLSLGSMIEGRQGTLRLVGLILAIGIVSNLGQYLLYGPNFGGMSGVIYGLLGYVWMKCRFDPRSGYWLSMNMVTLMMIWLVLCLLEVIPSVANGAHVIGLLAGFLLGFIAAKLRSMRTA
jgi:rhomboid protease GlpG